jgi:hypothetical protein
MPLSGKQVLEFEGGVDQDQKQEWQIWFVPCKSREGHAKRDHTDAQRARQGAGTEAAQAHWSLRSCR